MALLETGRVCIRTKGRHAGAKCVILGTEGKFAVVEGEHIRRKKCNPMHLFATSHIIKVSKGLSHEEIVKHLKGVKFNE